MAQRALFILLGLLVSLALAWSSHISGDVQEQGRVQASTSAQIESLRRDVGRIEEQVNKRFDRLDEKLDRVLDLRSKR